MINNIILNAILVVFPVLVYFIYNCYRELRGDKYNNLLLNLSLVTSMYLCFKYGNTSNIYLLILFVNLPIIIGYLTKQSSVSVLISLILLVYFYFVMNMNIYILILNYIAYFLVYIYCMKEDFSNNLYILITLVIQEVFICLEYFVYVIYFNWFELLFLLILFFCLAYLLLFLFNYANKVTSLYSNILDLENEKRVRSSLFKITHEVKNPIAVCKGYLDMLDINDKVQVSKYIPIIKDELVRSLSIMNDFMEFNKISIEKDIIDINMVLEDVIDEISMLNNNINISASLVQDDVYIMGDFNRLKQVFINILKNSIEAIGNRCDGKIVVQARELNNNYYIEIVDNGCGIDEYTLSRMGEMFYTTKRNGNGIGVSLSYEIINLHDGEIKYSSLGVDRGCKVIVKLPIAML